MSMSVTHRHCTLTDSFICSFNTYQLLGVRYLIAICLSFFFFSQPPHSTYSSQARDQIRDEAATYATDVATQDPKPTVLSRGSNLHPTAPETSPILLRQSKCSLISILEINKLRHREGRATYQSHKLRNRKRCELNQCDAKSRDAEKTSVLRNTLGRGQHMWADGTLSMPSFSCPDSPTAPSPESPYKPANCQASSLSRAEAPNTGFTLALGRHPSCKKPYSTVLTSEGNKVKVEMEEEINT